MVNATDGWDLGRLFQIAVVPYTPPMPLPVQQPGGAWVFWMTESQVIQGTQRDSASADWAPPVTLASPITEDYSPIVAVNPTPADIAVFMHGPDGRIMQSRYQGALVVGRPRVPLKV
jgi:hypothetical protein